MTIPSSDDPRGREDSRLIPSSGIPVDNHALVPLAPRRTELMLTAVADHANAVKGAPLDQKALLASLRRRWFPALSLGIIAALLAAGLAWFVVPLPYTTFAELRILATPSKLLFTSHESGTAFEVYKQTQMRMVKSQFVLNAALRDKEIAQCSLLRDEPYPLEWLEKNISVTSPATEFVRVSLSGKEPKELAKIVNAIKDEYINEVVNIENNVRNKRISELDKVHRDIEDQLRTRRTTLKRLVKNLQTGDPLALTEKQKMMMELSSALRKQRAQMQFELMSARIKLAATEEPGGPNDDVQVPDAVVEAELAKNLELQMAETYVKQKQEHLSRVENVTSSKEHKRVVTARAELENAKKNCDELKIKLRPQVAARIATEALNRAQASVGSLKETIRLTESTVKQLDQEMDKQTVETKQTGEWSLEVETLKDDLLQAKVIDQRVTTEIEQLKVELKADSRVVKYRDAETPNQPDYDKKLRTVGLAGFGAMALVAACIIWLDVRTQRISSLEEIATGLRLPILGSLPKIPRYVATAKKSRTAIARADVWQGSLMESVDSARVMLLRRAELDNAKVAMVVSAMMSEGKTTLSCHLATSLARAGYRTLLMDTDIRRPSVHRVFDLPSEPGVCELLRQEVQLSDAIAPTPQDGLFVISAGRITHDALRQLAQDALNPIVSKLREDYDFVIVDSSPILPVTDSLLVSQYVDGVIFSIRRDVSQYPKVATACQRLAMIGIPLWGAVVIGLDQTPYGYRYAYTYGATQSV